MSRFQGSERKGTAIQAAAATGAKARRVKVHNLCVAS